MYIFSGLNSNSAHLEYLLILHFTPFFINLTMKYVFNFTVTHLYTLTKKYKDSENQGAIYISLRKCYVQQW